LTTLKALEHQSMDSFEVLVVDQSDLDQQELIGFHSDKYQYRYQHIEEKSLPNARNVAARLAEGDILIFIDDDVVPAENLGESYLQLFNELGEAYWLVGGRIREEGSRILSNRAGIIGGKVTCYGKALKNFDADRAGDCEWVAGGNFAIRRNRFMEIGGFDNKFIGSAVFEDADFSYRIRKAEGKIYYSPRPQLEHLRIKTGGTRTVNSNQAMSHRAHNTVYFFRKHKSLWQLPLVFLYMNGVAVKEWVRRTHSMRALGYAWWGFLKGLGTPIP